MPKKRFFALVSHCLLNPATRVHLLGRRYEVADQISHYLLSRSISIIQLPCPEFTAMGYWRNPQGRQQYDNVFFRKHCRRELESYVDMVCELVKNDNTPLCYIGVQGSPTCSIRWGKHKTNKYKTESIHEDPNASKDTPSLYGVMTEVLDEMLKGYSIDMPFVEAPIKESLKSEATEAFFDRLDELVGIPKAYISKENREEMTKRSENRDV